MKVDKFDFFIIIPTTIALAILSYFTFDFLTNTKPLFCRSLPFCAASRFSMLWLSGFLLAPWFFRESLDYHKTTYRILASLSILLFWLLSLMAIRVLF